MPLKVTALLARIEKAKRYLSYFWHARKCWSWPRKSDVLIFDACGAELLLENLRDWSVEVLPVRGESINLPVMLTSLFPRGNKSDAYFDAYIRKVKPKLVVTFIDNTLAFYRLAQRHNNVKTMFIQNGWRGYHADIFEQLDTLGNTDKLMVDYMLCFGRTIGQHYQRYIAGSIIPMGSLRNNRQARSPQIAQETIAFISQWHREGVQVANRRYSQEEFIAAVDRYVLEFLGEYAQKHGKRINIIPRTHVESPARVEEARYFSLMLGEPCHFLEYDTPGSSYKAIDAAAVVVGVDSTLVYESIARGTKTAIFSIRGAMMGVKGFDYGWPAEHPADGSFWTNTPSRDKFRSVMDYLFSVTDEEWREELRQVSFENLMMFDSDNAMLKKILAQVLAA